MSDELNVGFNAAKLFDFTIEVQFSTPTRTGWQQCHCFSCVTFPHEVVEEKIILSAVDRATVPAVVSKLVVALICCQLYTHPNAGHDVWVLPAERPLGGAEAGNVVTEKLGAESAGWHSADEPVCEVDW